jgi:hypothetical protein
VLYCNVLLRMYVLLDSESLKIALYENYDMIHTDHTIHGVAILWISHLLGPVSPSSNKRLFALL